MKVLVKKSIVFALLLGMHLPALGYKWTIYNALGKTADFQLNVSGQVKRMVIPAKAHVEFNYNKWGGAGGALWMGGLCLTSIYAMPFGETLQGAQLRAVDEAIIKGTLSSVGVSGLFLLATLDWALPALALVIGGLVTVGIILTKMCNDGKWLVAKDKSGNMYAITVK